jgi:hypothetical protein
MSTVIDAADDEPPRRAIVNPFGTGSRAGGALLTAEAQRAIAEVQAALIMAHMNPRDERASMDRILKECMRPGLAEEATYEYARGGNRITGPSIRLGETALRCWGNMEAGVKELTRVNGVSECMAYAWDYQNNVREVRTFTVRHWRDTQQGGYALKDERDIYEMVANYGARRKRAAIIALIPGDVWTAALAQVEETNKTNFEVTPENIGKMLERFAAFAVTKPMLEKYVQRSLESMPPAMMARLRNIYNSLRDQMSTPADWFEVEQGAPESKPGASRMSQAKEKVRAGKGKGKEAPPPAPKAEEKGKAVTYAQVADAMQHAKTREAVTVAADDIRYIKDDAQRAELEAMLEARLREFDEARGDDPLNQ